MGTFLIGMAGAVFALAIFFAGAFTGAKLLRPGKAETPEMSEEEKIAAEEERKLRLEEQRAFNALLNYNADVAYGEKMFGSDVR